MQIAYPSHHRWERPVADDIFSHFSPRTAGKVRTALELLPKEGINYTIAPLSESFFRLFLPLYTDLIGKKDNAIVHDVFENTLGQAASEFPYYSFSLYENDIFIGGTVFSLRPDRISLAYRVFKPDWNTANIKITPAYIGEYAVAKFAQQHNLAFISHGRDRNPYGLNAAIGLATFKLSVGCSAYIPTDCEIKTLETETITADTLVLKLPPEGNHILEACLITTKETESRYIQVKKYPELLSVEVLYRD